MLLGLVGVSLARRLGAAPRSSRRCAAARRCCAPATWPGWKAVRAEPGIAELAPELSGLTVTGRVEAPALVHAGDAVRVTALLFATPADAARALARAKEPAYRPFLEHELGGAVVGRGPGTGYRLHVTRAAEPGCDTVELYLVRGGRVLALVELLSADGFDKAARATGCSASSGPGSVAEERPDELVERLAVAARDHRGRQRPHGRGPRDLHRQRHLAEVVPGLQHRRGPSASWLTLSIPERTT